MKEIGESVTKAFELFVSMFEPLTQMKIHDNVALFLGGVSISRWEEEDRK